MTDIQPIRRAVISVSDKTGLLDFARALESRGVELISTGGTHRALVEAGIRATAIESFTGFPEILGGRVKTLHPKIFAGILARRDQPEDIATLERQGIPLIDLVVVNLYPFARTIAREGVTWEESIEQIDIGGPSLLRAAAKNHAHVAVVCDPADYGAVLAEMEEHGGGATLGLRRRLAGKVFAHTSQYDALIAGWFLRKEGEVADAEPCAEKAAANSARGAEAQPNVSPSAEFPPVFTLALPKVQDLRYGENPHQAAAFYADPAVDETCLARARQLHGKELSYNNLLDAEGALEMIRDISELASPQESAGAGAPKAAAVIVKHANPCGIALGETLAEAYEAARACDPESAYGGIVALSQTVDMATASLLTETFLEVVLAPAFDSEATEFLCGKKKNLRLLATGPFTPKRPMRLARGIVGGVLLMDRDLGRVGRADLKTVTRRQPSGEDLDALLFAWRCVKWVKSNAIVYADRRSTIGIGAGQMSRADSARLGASKARRPLQGAYMASDAFFPFRDSVDEAARAGIRAIIQPGGSVRDAETIAAADEHDLIMVFTGMRHFRH